MRIGISTIAAGVLLALPATAEDDLEIVGKGMAMGRLIASEEYCGMAFDQPAIARWIRENVPASTMDFPQLMELGSASEEFEREGRSASAKTAHCAAMRQTAVHHGFIPAN